MLTILNRCVRRQLLRRFEHGYTVNSQVAGEISFSRDRGDYARREQELLDHFVDYVKSTFGECIDVEDAEAALFDFIRRYDMEILLLRNGAQRAIPDNPRGKNNRRLAYMLGRFAIYAYKSRCAIFDTISEIALGNMLTAAVLLDDYDWPSDTVRNSNIYLDSPIILRMIGTAGESQATEFCSFVSMLRTKGAKLWIFRHSREEAVQILDRARHWVGRNDFDPALASRAAIFFRQQGFTDSEIERYILRVDEYLSQYHIEVFEMHPYMENREHQVDEDHIRRAIESCYGSSGPGLYRDVSEDGIRKDVASIAAVYRLRAGKRAKLLRDAEHVLVTMNSALSRASRVAVEDVRSREVPACVTDVFLGTIMWINSPREAKEASRRRLMADCYSAVTPDRRLEAGIVHQARKLRDQDEITEDDFLLLTTSFVTKDLLAERTLNDPDALDSRTSLEILEDLKDRIRKEERDLRSAVELERVREHRARVRAERERVRESERVAKIVDDQARLRAVTMNVIQATAGSVGVVVIPVVGAVLVSPWSIAVTAVGLISGAYLSFGRGFTLKSNYERLYAKYRERIRAKYVDE